MKQDLLYALRMMRKNFGSTLVMVLSLGIGIGANSAIFSVVDGLLLRPLPFPQPDRLTAIWIHSPGIGILRDWPSPGQFNDVRSESKSFEEISISRLTSFTLTGVDQPQRIDGMRTSAALMNLMGARPMLGRTLLPADDNPGEAQVALLSHRLWQRIFGSDRNIVGRSITLDGNQFTVAGVLDEKFSLNSEVMPAEGPLDKVDIYLPLKLSAEFLKRRGDENYNLIGRLKPGVSVQQAQSEVDAIASRIQAKDKRDRTFGMTVIGLQEQVVGDVRRSVLVLLGSVALVLLIACANVANLLLTRSAARQKEVAIRTAMGASWSRLVRQLLTESVLIGLCGGIMGLAVAQASLLVVRSMNPGNVPRLDEIGINATVLAFTFAVAIATGILFGLAPALPAVRVDFNTALKAGSRTGQTHSSGLSLSRHSLRGLLVISELALSLVLLAGAGLLIRSFLRLQEVPPGFTTDRVLSMSITATGAKYREAKPIQQFYQEVGSRVAHLPGVESVGFVSALPLTGSVSWGGINVEGYQPQAGQELQADQRTAGAAYFEAMRIPLLKGRFFSEHDTSESQQVAIIDENFARRFWPNGDAAGKHLWFDPKKPMVIVGVVGNVKQYGLDNDAKIAAYFPQSQRTSRGMYMVVRTPSSNPATLAGSAAREIHAVDANVPVYEIQTMNDRLYSSLARRRFAGVMLAAFAGFALLLAVIGLAGVLSYLVEQSKRDIGVRMALGAEPADIVRMVLGQGMQLIAAGLVAGLAGSLALTRVMNSLLFGVGSTDALTFSTVSVILTAAAMLAVFIPARRAARVDPIVALRDE